MDEKWVTLAIRTYQRAKMIQSVLESHNIETVIHNLNLRQPEMAVGVRVRIRERDLPQALSIVEEVERAWNEETKVEGSDERRIILIPIDITDQINEVCKYGFYYAKQLNADIVFLHAYIAPSFTITPHTTTDFSTYSIAQGQILRRIIKSNKGDIENLKNLVTRWVEIGDLPDIKFSFELKEGVPEDVIYDYSKKHKPIIIVMSSNNKHRDADVLGSVTSEILETSRVPVIAIPANTELLPTNINKIAFFTNFDQNDLIAIDKIISMSNQSELELIFIHASDKKDKWNEIMLVGIKEYFANHYPNIKTEYAFIANEDKPEELQPFLEDKNIELIALNRKKRSLFARFFSVGMASKMLFNVNIPLLVLRE